MNGKCDTGTGRGHVASRRLLEASRTIDVCTLNARSYAADTSAVALGTSEEDTLARTLGSLLGTRCSTDIFSQITVFLPPLVSLCFLLSSLNFGLLDFDLTLRDY